MDNLSDGDFNNAFENNDFDFGWGQILTPSQESVIMQDINLEGFSTSDILAPVPETELAKIVNTVPSTQDWRGNYNFDISFGSQGSGNIPNKSASWTYSASLDKLFVTVFKHCPIKVRAGPEVPSNCRIRVMPIFSKAEDISELVRRCPNHSASGEPHNQDGKHDPEHLVRCTSTPWIDYDNKYADRKSIVIPYLLPEAGADTAEYLFQFMCYGSCVGGLNRKPLKLIFTLEMFNGEVLGRRVIDLKICACPGRDRRTEEESFNKKSEQIETYADPPAGKRKIDDDGCFIIKVKRKEHYDMLNKIRMSLELSDLVPSDRKAAYLKKEGIQGKSLLASNSKLPQKPRLKKDSRKGASASS